MLERRVAVAGPGQTKVVTGKVVTCVLVFSAFRAQGFHIEQVHVLHVGLKAFRALPGIANGPETLVDFTQDVFWHRLVHAFYFLPLVIDRQFLAEPEFVGKLLHDHVIAAALPQGFDDFFAPLNRAVGRGTRAAGLKLGGGWQKVHRPIGIEVFGPAGHGRHGCGGRRVRIHHHQQIELVHGTFHFQTTCLRIWRMAPVKHAA